MENMNNNRRHRTVRNTIRRGTLIAIAATLVMLLGVTAYAVYQYSLRDAVAELTVGESTDSSGEAAAETVQALSLNGFIDSPECQAWQEWEDYLTQWQADNPDWFSERGVDDSYYETSESYATLYGAYARETGEKLDEILAKYGLTAHTDLEAFATHGQLCRALGVDAVIDGYDVLGTYLYDDGSFKMDGTMLIDGDTAWFEMFVAAKGSFSRISGAVPEGEERTYTTASGTELIMVTNEEDGSTTLIAGLDGCYVEADIETADKALAEAFADSIQWETLNGLFATAKAREETAASVAAYMADPGMTLEDADDGVVVLTELLGSYTPAELPDGYTLYSVDYAVPNGSYISYYQISFLYQSQNGTIHYSYRTLLDGETEPEGFGETSEPSIEDTACTVNGYDGVLTTYNKDNEDTRFYSLSWLDTDRDLMFFISVGKLSAEETIALAESVTADDPTLEANAEAYAARAEQIQAELTALEEAAQAKAQAIEVDEAALTQESIDRLGDYEITAAGYTCTFVTGSGVDEYQDWYTGEYLGYTDSVGKSFENSDGVNLTLTYDRYWDKDDESVLLNEHEFANAQKDSEQDWTVDEYTFGLSVGGHDAYLRTGEETSALATIVWLDEDSGLIFSLSIFEGSLTAEELIAIAETVAAAEEETEDTSPDALERLGDYEITDASYTYDCLGGASMVGEYYYNDDEYCYSQNLDKVYKNDAGESLSLGYRRYWDTEDESVLLNEQVFESCYGNYFNPTLTFGLSVNGYSAYLVQEDFTTMLLWLDEDSGLIFSLDTCNDITTEELIAIAETVQPAA